MSPGGGGSGDAAAPVHHYVPHAPQQLTDQSQVQQKEPHKRSRQQPKSRQQQRQLQKNMKVLDQPYDEAYQDGYGPEYEYQPQTTAEEEDLYVPPMPSEPVKTSTVLLLK